jgi:gamma-glutamylcyclotransferase (GGCT)/AIG2-like uncharacterized protein YtfP
MDDGCNLFVYGTLMSTAVGDQGAAQRARLLREARLLGAATIRGQLYDLGDFPGVILEDDANSIVYGELVRLNDADTALAWLDQYEEISPGGSPSDLYRRVRTVASLAGGERILCWTYELRGPANGLKVLSEGSWQSGPQARSSGSACG